MQYKLLIVSVLFVVVAYDLADAQEVKKISNEEIK